MTYFAIRHIPTGKFLPQLRKRRGHTHTEPMVLTEAVPRLHLKLPSAKVALFWWLKGKGHESFSGGGAPWDDYNGGPKYDGNDYTKQPDRRCEDMEIVKVELTI